MSLAILLAPVLPCIDLPQHLAMATELRRLWDGDPWASANLASNVATHNAGIAVFAAALAPLVPIELGGRLFLATYPPLLVYGVARFLRARGLPAWRVLLVLPATLGFSFGWGFANFCVGTGLAWLALALVAEQLDQLRAGRAAALAFVASILGATHVMAMLLTAIVAFALGLEHLVRGARTRRAVAFVALAGAPLLVGCLYDLAVLSAHLAKDAGSYTSLPQGFEEFGFFRKIIWFGTFVSGLYRTYADTVVAWGTIALLSVMAIASRKRGAPPPAGRPVVAPLVVLLVFYFAVPHVFVNTHLVFQRVAGWVVVAALFAVPPLADGLDRRFARWGSAIGAASTALFPIHVAWLALETRGLDATLAAVPRGALLTGYIEEPRTASMRMTSLSHVAALAVPRGAADEGFSFARLLGMPVVYRPGHVPPYPVPSWEHGAHPYRSAELLARRYPFLFVRVAWEEEPPSITALRLFGADHAKVVLVARHGRWSLWDTNAIAATLP